MAKITTAIARGSGWQANIDLHLRANTNADTIHVRVCIRVCNKWLGKVEVRPGTVRGVGVTTTSGVNI